MKKFILIIITIAFFIYPSICLSSYLIELKNGSTFITNHYWKEGRQIKFYYRGGVVGIHKDSVKEIKGTFTGVFFDQEPEKREEKIGEKKSAENSGKKDSPERLGKDLQKKQLQEELRKLQDENTEAWEEYRKISEQEHRSKAERDEARKRAFEISIKKQELIRKLKRIGDQEKP